MRRLLNRLAAFGRPPAPVGARSSSSNSASEAADLLIAEGNRAESAGNLLKACEQYRLAVEAAPGYAKPHLNLGIGLEATGDANGAIKSYEAALAIDSESAYANYNLAKLLYARGDGEMLRVERLLCAALEHKHDFPEARVALANVYDSQGNLAAAATVLEVALKQRPDYAGAWFNYGDILRRLERLVDAEAALRRSIELAPTLLYAYHLLGNLFRADGRVGEALQAFGTARKLAPDRFDFESMELHALTLSDEISADALYARHRAFGERLEKAFPPRFAPLRNNQDLERPLRVGYVSSDFNVHPVAWFAIPVLERHDRSAYEIYCYSTRSKTDDVTRRVQALADVWRDASSMSDTEFADAINGDAIDVLVDLTGHAGVTALGVFSQQPAPVQVSWLGYLNTTGLTRIQYRLCDAYTDPPGMTDHLYTETLVRLPHSLWCFRPFFSIEHASEPPHKRNGFITFGSFNNAPKLSQTTRRLWSEILTRLPDSRLVVAGTFEGHARNRLIQELLDTGIAGSRLTIVPRTGLEEYFPWFDAVDIALDTTPYSGGTTTCDTLWMGVPVVTFPGSRPGSGSAASILSAVGLTEWIAATPEDYVRLAVEFAREKESVTKLRGSLRQRMRESPLMDEPQFVRDLEDAYRRMWRTWCKDVTP